MVPAEGLQGEYKVSWQTCACVENSQEKALFAAGCFLSLACGHCSIGCPEEIIPKNNSQWGRVVERR